MKWGIYTVFVVFGWIGGALLAPSDVAEKVATEIRSESKKPKRSHMITRGSYGERVDNEMREYQQMDSLKEIAVKMNKEKISPLRVKSFLGSRIQLLSKRQLLDKLEAGEIQTTDELAIAARKLTEESPHEVFDIYEQRSVPFYTMDGLYTFYNTMLWTWLQKDPASLQARIEGLTRGGAQQDISLRFSNFWAQLDPGAASEQFEKLVYLRNVTALGQQKLNGKAYADIIVRSWKAKDAEGLQNYIDALPDGAQKDLYLQSWLKTQ